MSKENIGTIYSRRRFLLKPSNVSDSGFKSSRGNKKIKRKIIKIIITALLLMIMLQLFFYYFEPIFETMCEEKVKSLVVKVIFSNHKGVFFKFGQSENIPL